jgi:hypothetical protein
MSNQATNKEDFYRGLFLLRKKFHTPNDLLKYWSFCGPWDYDCPSIEKVQKNRNNLT